MRRGMRTCAPAFDRRGRWHICVTESEAFCAFIPSTGLLISDSVNPRDVKITLCLY